MKEIVVLETWSHRDLPYCLVEASFRLVTDGDDIWVEYKYSPTQFWRKDGGFSIGTDEMVNKLIPIFANA